MFIISIVKQMS